MRSSLTLAALGIVAAAASFGLVFLTRCNSPGAIVGWGVLGLDLAALAFSAAAWVAHIRHYKGHGPANLTMVAANSLALLGLVVVAGVLLMGQFLVSACPLA